MMLKQTGFKPRGGSFSNASEDAASKNSANNNAQTTSPTSGASPTSLSSPISAIRGGAGSIPTAANADKEKARRKSSGSFSGLTKLKRESTDGSRPNHMEQKPGSSGMFTSMWNKTMRGSS